VSSTLFRDAEAQGRRYSTLKLSASVVTDGAALARLCVRAAAVRCAATGNHQQFVVGGEDLGDPDRYLWRVWWEPAAKWRSEIERTRGQTDVIVVRDSTAMVYVNALRTLYTNELPQPDHRWEIIPPPPGLVELPTVANRHEVFPLIGPTLPEAEWTFATLVEEHIYNGRVTRRVRAIRRAGVTISDDRRASGYWSGVDEYECIVDDGLQILLRLIAIADGELIADISVDEVVVDAHFPSETFTFVPPRGARIAYVAQTN
jgi:hypothetical protein